MKKINFALLGLAGLALASCSQDDLIGPAGGDGNYNVTVKLPADMATRALGDGLTADVLHIAVFDADNDNAFVFEDQATFGGQIQTTVSLNLPQGKSYNIAFFAVSDAGESVYQFNPVAPADYDASAGEFVPNITVDYTAYVSTENLADAYDCFYQLEPTGKIGGTAINKEVLLSRPVAQINWGTNDLSQAVVDDAAFGANGQNLVSTLDITEAYTQFSLLGNGTDGPDVMGTPVPVTLKALASPASSPESAAWAFPVNPTLYKYIAMQYVLAPQEQGVYDLTLDVYNNPDKDNATVQNDVVAVNSAPVQANYRTNIYGSLLTNPTEFTVTKNNEWGQPDYDPSFELAIQRGGYFTLEKDYVLSKSYSITNRLTIDLNGHTITNALESDEGLFVVYPGGDLTITGEGTMKTNDQTEVYDGVDYPICIFVWTEGGTATIEGGYYEAPGPGQLLYCYQGLINVTGGKYYLKGTDLNAYQYYPINCYDDSYKAGTANFVVTGGSFYNFNPADNNAEGAGKHTSFLAEGYKSVESKVDGASWFTVVPNNTVVAADADALVAAMQEGSDVTLAADITISPASLNSGYGTTGLNLYNGQTFDGNGHTLNIEYADKTWDSGINTTGGTIKNLTVTGSMRGIFIGHSNTASYHGPVILENVTIEGTVYTISCDQGTNNTLQATNCTFNGWTSFAATLGNVSFTNCNFGEGQKSGYSPYAYLRNYAPTTFVNCMFSSNYQIDTQAAATFENCYFGNAALTNSNLSSLVTSNTQNATVK